MLALIIPVRLVPVLLLLSAAVVIVRVGVVRGVVVWSVVPIVVGGVIPIVIGSVTPVVVGRIIPVVVRSPGVLEPGRRLVRVAAVVPALEAAGILIERSVVVSGVAPFKIRRRVVCVTAVILAFEPSVVLIEGSIVVAGAPVVSPVKGCRRVLVDRSPAVIVRTCGVVAVKLLEVSVATIACRRTMAVELSRSGAGGH